MARLEILDSTGHPVRSVELSSRSLLVGRGLQNDVVLSDDTVSSRHAAVWEQGGDVHVEDLGSRNGTWLGETRLTGRAQVPVGGLVRFGEATQARVVGSVEDVAILCVRDLDSGTISPVRSDRFRIGPGLDADLRLEPGHPQCTVLFHPDGTLELGRGADSSPLRAGDVFTLGGRRFRVEAPEALTMPTRDLAHTPYPYRLTIREEGPGVVLAPMAGGRSIELEGDNRAVLLYLLARQLHDAEAGSDSTWLSDDEVATGIWGRFEGERQLRNLNVLVWRTRKLVEEHDMDPWFLEKSNRRLRVRVQEVVLRQNPLPESK